MVTIKIFFLSAKSQQHKVLQRTTKAAIKRGSRISKWAIKIAVTTLSP